MQVCNISSAVLGTGPGQPFRHRVAAETAAWQCRSFVRPPWPHSHACSMCMHASDPHGASQLELVGSSNHLIASCCRRWCRRWFVTPCPWLTDVPLALSKYSPVLLASMDHRRVKPGRLWNPACNPEQGGTILFLIIREVGSPYQQCSAPTRWTGGAGGAGKQTGPVFSSQVGCPNLE
jgi:hypothetical protein